MATSSSPTQDPDKDEEGLLQRYDVILCGTGLVQSILASALARAGKSILHVDGNDFYGEHEAVVSRSFFDQQQDENGEDEEENVQEEKESFIKLRSRPALKIHSSQALTHIPLQVGTQVSTPYGTGRISSLNPTVKIHLEHWMLANGASPILYMDPTNTSALVPTQLARIQTLLEQRFALDVTPTLLFASGPAVEGLLASGVSDYLEFKSMEGLLWCSSSQERLTLERVPCSKADVFSSTLLSPLEKRQLMKLLQLTLDYATALQAANEQEEINTAITKEESLDKTTTTAQTDASTATTTDASSTPHPPTSTEPVQFLNEFHLNQGRSLARPQNKAIATADLETLQSSLELPFDLYLQQNKLAKHAKLRSLVQYALALQCSESSSTRTAMGRLCQHVQALGRFGTTAFLISLYGSGELSQAFCRSAAVHGATYLLRRPPRHVCVSSQKEVTGIVLGGDESAETPEAKGDKEIHSAHVVVPQHALWSSGNNTTATSRRRLLRRISIVQGHLLPQYAEQRHVLILPRDQVGNSHVIHGIVLDAGVAISPPGCTVLHLSTVVEESDTDDSEANVLEKAVALLQAQEIYHVCFSYALSSDSMVPKNNIGGLHVCHASPQSLVADDAFAQAREIFEKICPGQPFLKLSEEMDRAIQERLAGRNDDNDEERTMLESAMNMVDIATTETTTTSEATAAETTATETTASDTGETEATASEAIAPEETQE